MALVPKRLVEIITFYVVHLIPWAANATALDFTADQITALQTAVDDAQAAREARDTAASAAKAATMTYHQAMDHLSSLGATMIARIRATAQAKNDPGLYALAEIPGPKEHAPVPAPGKPTDAAVSLKQDGSLKLTWKCKNPEGAAGTRYEIHRKVDGGSLQYVGAVGDRAFTDTAVPVGAAVVTYAVRGVRSNTTGESTEFNVNFGPGAAGSGAGVRVSEAAPSMRKAA